MRGKGATGRGEHAARNRVPIGRLLSPPLIVLGLFSIAIRSADSSVSFRMDHRRVLETLKETIEETTPPTVAGVPELREVREIVRRGDTFGQILERVAIIAPADVSRWLAESRHHPSLSRLQPGHAFAFLVPSGTDRLAGLQYELSPGATLVMREEDERIVSSVERLPRMVDVRVVSGTIETSLYAAAVKNGVPDHVVSKIADIFGWDVDFATALRRGDSFRVAYEDVHDGNGGHMPEGKVLAVELDAEKAFLRAVYYEAGDDGGHYYSPDGHPFGRTFLRYPVEFTRISSQFSHSRFHPVLRVRRPHLGVDFAAPMGTPVRSIAGGTVRYAGWKGANGRFIKIDHGDGVESSYSHLKRIAPGIRQGARIHMGQVIGAVGATGLATGPHLHFALYRNGVYVNPMRAALPAPPPLSEEFMAGFERARDELLAQLALAPSTAPAVVASADTASRAN